jgi:hypothetical protein
MRTEIGMTRLIAPPNISAIGLPQPDGTTYEVRPGEDRMVDVPDAIAAELNREHGFEILVLPQYSDEEFAELHARRDELKARLDGLEADQADVTGDGVAAAARLEEVKARLAAADASLDEVREAERAVEETRSRAALIAEAVAVGLAALSDVARQVNGEESIRERFRQNAEAEPLIETAAENVEAFVAGIVMAVDALADRAAILLVDDDGVIRFKASRGLSEKYQAAVFGHSPWARGTLNAEPIVVPDVRLEDSLAGYRDILEREGIRALVFVPLSLDAGVFGKFVLYYNQPRECTTEELRIAQAISPRSCLTRL